MNYYRSRSRHVLSIIALILFPTCVTAQTEAPKRPTIGIAFEGGGALGLAHVGVLEWFEEHRIPIDYVAGTSMGGLVGGIYATGMRAHELNEFVSTMDWNGILSGIPSYRDLSYRRKEDVRAFQNYLQFGLRHGFRVPGGLNSGQEITFLLDRIAFPYSDQSFDELPIPFRCVATDLVTGKPHVFKDGPLGVALRSTMSLPAVFTPVVRDGQIYVDGGLLNNLPVDVVKQMGADIVIAVSLNPSAFKPQGGESMFSIMDRSISVMIEANEIRNAEMSDIMISVDLSNYSSTDYAAEKKIIQQGYDAAARKSALLSKLAVSEAAWEKILAARDARRRSPKVPEFISVTGVEGPLAHNIQEALSDQVGKPVDPERLKHDLNLISGTERFSSLSYRLTEVDGKPGLAIRADESGSVPPFLKLGVFIDGADYDNVLFTANARITALGVAGFGSEWRSDLSVGSTWGLSTELYRPLTPATRWFVAPRAFANNSPFELYDRSARIADYRLRQYGGGLDLGYAINRFSEVRIGYEIGYLNSSLSVGQPILPTPAGRFGASAIRYDLDTLHSPTIPRRGDAARARVQWTDTSPGAPLGFPLAELYLAAVHPVSKRGSVFFQGYGGSTFGHENTGLPQFFLGGPGRLSAYGVNELRTDQYFLVRLGYIHELFKLPPLLGNKVYFMSAYELGKVFGTPPSGFAPSSNLPMDGSVSVVMDTLFGPLAVGAAVGDTGHHKVYFSLGRIF